MLQIAQGRLVCILRALHAARWAGAMARPATRELQVSSSIRYSNDCWCGID